MEAMNMTNEMKQFINQIETNCGLMQFYRYHFECIDSSIYLYIYPRATGLIIAGAFIETISNVVNGGRFYLEYNHKLEKPAICILYDEILSSYAPLENEQLVCIESFDDRHFNVFAVYVNGEYDRRIKIVK